MSRPNMRLPSLLFRLLLYVAAIAILLMYSPDSKNPVRFFAVSRPDTLLTIAGFDLAPALIQAALDFHRADYPNLHVELKGGGTAAALEALANRRADAAFLNRPPTSREQELVKAARRDTVLWLPVAVGGLFFVHREDAGAESLSTTGLRQFLAGAPDERFRTLYVPDPNLGLWDALLECLGVSPPGSATPGQVVFLRDETAVLQAVRAEGASLGLVGTLSLPGSLSGLATIPVAGDPPSPAEPPTDEAISGGRYPLFHRLYVSCLDRGGAAGSMFVTNLTSDRGQRRIERLGYLPERRVMREVVLSTRPVGRTG